MILTIPTKFQGRLDMGYFWSIAPETLGRLDGKGGGGEAEKNRLILKRKTVNNEGHKSEKRPGKREK